MSDKQSVLAEAGYSVNFTLYNTDGLRCQFTVREDAAATPDVFLQRVDKTQESLAARGYSVTEPGLQPGQQTEEVTGWVLGQKDDGSPVVWVFGHQALQYKIDTIWEEKIDSLPFSVAGAKQWPTNQAPLQDKARKDGYFREYKAKVVMEDHPYRKHGPDSKRAGEPFKVITSWVGHEQPAAEEKPEDWPELYASTTPEACEQNWIRWLDTRGKDISGRAKAMVDLAQVWIDGATTTEQLDAIPNYIESAIAANVLRVSSKGPLIQRVALKADQLKLATEEVPF